MLPALPTHPLARLAAPRLALAAMLLAGGLASPRYAPAAQVPARAAGSSARSAPPPQRAASSAFNGPITLHSSIDGGSDWFISPTGGTTNGTPSGTVNGTAPGLAVRDATWDPAGTPRDDAFDYGLTLWVNNKIFSPTTVISYADELDFGSNTVDGLVVSEQYFLPDDQAATLRSLVGLANYGTSAVSVPVYWASNLGSDANTTIYDSSTIPSNQFDTDDRWVITDDGPANHDAVVTHVLGGPGAPLSPPTSVVTNVFTYNANTRGVGATYSVTVPAGQFRYLLFYAQLSVTDTVAAAGAAAFDTNPTANSSLIRNISHNILLNVVNWAFTNIAPLALDDNVPAFTNGGGQTLDVTENDSDLDNDHLEISAVGSPAHGTASLGQDPYGARFVVYTPTADYAGPDTFNYTLGDGLGGFDSAQVNVSVGGPVAVSLPWHLVSGAGQSSMWQIEYDGGTDNGLPQGGSCANEGGVTVDGGWMSNYPFGFEYSPFDEGAMVWVGGQVITSTGQVTLTAHNLETAPMTVGFLRASLSYYGLPESDTLRTVVTLYNPTGGTVNTPITFVSNLSSGPDTAVRATSSGDTVFNLADRWLVTSDDPVEPNYAVITHALYGPGPVTAPANLVSQTVFDCYGTEGVLAKYSVTVPPGGTRRLMFFNQMSLGNANAAQAALAFNRPLTPDLLRGLSAAERAQIVNWVMPKDIFLPLAHR